MENLDVGAVGGDELAARQAYQVQERIRNTIAEVRTAWVRLAEDLFQFNQQRMWADLGFESFDEWVASPDIDYERRWVYELIRMWRELVVKAGADPEQLKHLEPSKLQDVLPAVRRQQVTLGQALSDAGELSRTDLRERYGTGGSGSTQTPTGSAPDVGTALNAEDEPEWMRCPTCGQRCRETDLR